MGLNLFARAARCFARTHLIAKIRNRAKYPGFGIPDNVNLDIHGDFAYGNGCGIGEGTNIIIPENATLLLGDNCYVGRHVELGPRGHIEIGSHTSVQDRCIMLGNVTLGRYCAIAPNVYISSGRHYFDLMPSWLIKDQDKWVANDKGLASIHSKPVIIEDDCWLGINVVVMSGVTIGKGAVVGANSVVTNDVEPYTVVAGAPAKFVKKRLDFVPPVNISYSNPHDWPYFYSGFEISQLSLEKYAVYEGIVAQKEFVICLNAAAGTSIHLSIRGIGSPECTLIYEGQRMKISNEMQEVRFQLDDVSKTKFHFSMQSDCSNSLVVVQGAWIQ
jgi:acetyltransferase-like isoleucine patch superfamily enzyme